MRSTKSSTNGSLRRTADEVFAEAQKADVVIGPIYSVDDILADPQIAARNNIIRSERQVPMPAVLPWISNIMPNSPAPSPMIGEHSAEALRFAGYAKAEIERLNASGLMWNDGRRVAS